MSDDNTGAGSKPTYIAYFIKDGAERGFWHECGAAWEHKDGRGLRLRLFAMPVGGVVELRINEPSERRRPEGADDAAGVGA